MATVERRLKKLRDDLTDDQVGKVRVCWCISPTFPPVDAVTGKPANKVIVWGPDGPEEWKGEPIKTD